MRKDKYRFFKTVGQITYTLEEQEEKQIEEIKEQSQTVERSSEMDMFMSLYDNYEGAEEIKEGNLINNSYQDEDFYKSNNQLEYKNTDLYLKYEIDREMIVTAKEARTTTDKNKKFLVSKAPITFNDLEKQKKQKKQNQSMVTEADSVYKVSHKMRKSGITHQAQNQPIERIGFIEVTDKQSQFISPTKLEKQTQQNKIVGMLEDNKPILKHKPFNSRKLGYLPVQVSETQHQMCQKQPINSNTQQFVEVVEQRDLKWLVIIILLFILLTALLRTQNLADWKFNLSNLTLFQTEEETHTAESSLQLSMNVSPTLKEEDNGEQSLNINLSSQPQEDENITYTAEIFTESDNTLIWRQDNIPTGETIESITVTLTPDQVKDQTIPCELKITIYKNGRYIGEMESSLTIHH